MRTASADSVVRSRCLVPRQFIEEPVRGGGGAVVQDLRTSVIRLTQGARRHGLARVAGGDELRGQPQSSTFRSACGSRENHTSRIPLGVNGQPFPRQHPDAAHVRIPRMQTGESRFH
jgi:hypothetical protein